MEAKEILEHLDITGVEDVSKLTPEEFRKLHDNNYIGRAVAHQDEELVGRVTGIRFGALETKARNIWKGLGMEFTPEEVKDKKLEDYLEVGAKKFEAKLKELNEKANHGNDKKLTDLQTQFEATKKQVDEYKQALETANGLVEQTKAETAGTLKNYKLTHQLTTTKSKIPFSETFDEFKKRGFDVVFNEKYNVELGEDDSLLIKDKAGNQIPNANKTGFLGFEDVYTQELKAAGGLKVNQGGNPAPQNRTTSQPNIPPEKTLYVHPNVAKLTGK